MSKRKHIKSSFLGTKKHTPAEKGNSGLSVSDKMQIITAIFTFLSLLGVIFTLSEMRKDRDTAYKPAVLMNATNFQVSWNSKGEEEWLSSLPNESNSSYEVTEDGSITGTYCLPVNIFPNNELESFTVVNVGVGTARDVCFEWDQNNLSRLSEYLAECNPSKSNFGTFGESAAFSFDERLVVTDIDRSVRLMYMLPGAQETYTLSLPMAYSILIHEIMKCGSLPRDVYIILYAHYSDIQGKNIDDIFYITINRKYYNCAMDSSGTATYQLAPALRAG